MAKRLLVVAIAALGLTIGSAGVASAHPVNPGDQPVVMQPGDCVSGIFHDAQGNIFVGEFCNVGRLTFVLFEGQHA